MNVKYQGEFASNSILYPFWSVILTVSAFKNVCDTEQATLGCIWVNCSPKLSPPIPIVYIKSFWLLLPTLVIDENDTVYVCVPVELNPTWRALVKLSISYCPVDIVNESAPPLFSEIHRIWCWCYIVKTVYNL